MNANMALNLVDLICRCNYMQLGDYFVYIGHHLVYVRCSRTIVGKDEKISAIDARVRVSIQL